MSEESRAAVQTRIPGPVVVVALLVLICGAAIALVGAYRVGITWDERTNMLSLQEFFSQGWNITADALINGRPNPAYIWGTYVYGPVSLLVTHALATFAGADSWGHVTFTAHAYAIRHVGGALIGLVGVAAAGLIVRAITGSWRWALLGAAVLASVPMWIGHSMMNIKDIPVGTGYTIASLGLVLLMRPDTRQSRATWVWGAVAVYAGAFVASGTRAAAGVPIAGSAVVAFLIWWLIMRQEREVTARPLRGALRRLLVSGVALVGTYLTLVLIYPNVWKNPFTLAYQGVVVSARFPFNEPILFAGQWVGQPVPWTYLPGWFLAQLPLLVIGAALVFTLLWVWRCIQAVVRPWSGQKSFVLVEASPALLQVFLLPLIAIIGRATVYNGVRQFLFVVPAAAVLATLGVWALSQCVTNRTHQRILGTVLWVVVSLGLLTPAVAQAMLFPYGYTFYNGVTAMRPIDGTWPTDYWRASSNELMRRLPAQGQESCAYEQSQKGTLMPCAEQPMFLPYVNERGNEAKAGVLSPGQYWVVRENQGQTSIPKGCVLHDAITRRLLWQTVTIAQILRCDANAVIPANGQNVPAT